MNIQISEHFNYRKLIRFTIPTIAMMIFTSIYGVVDGIFVSNFVGSEAFAAVNLIMPVLMILGSIGFMIGTGGSALVSKTLGEGKEKKAKEIFSMLVVAVILAGATLALRLYSISYLFSGINIFASAFFTALNDGMISALISFLRTLLFQVVMIFVLPAIFGLEGIWLAIVVAELMALAISAFCFKKFGEKYHYI